MDKSLMSRWCQDRRISYRKICLGKHKTIMTRLSHLRKSEFLLMTQIISYLSQCKSMDSQWCTCNHLPKTTWIYGIYLLARTAVIDTMTHQSAQMCKPCLLEEQWLPMLAIKEWVSSVTEGSKESCQTSQRWHLAWPCRTIWATLMPITCSSKEISSPKTGKKFSLGEAVAYFRQRLLLLQDSHRLDTQLSCRLLKRSHLLWACLSALVLD